MIGVAWPIVVSMLSYTLMGVADVLMVTQLGTIEVAAVGLGITAYFAIASFGWGLLGAVKVVVAQAHGADRTARTREAAVQGLVVAFVLGVGALLFLPLAGPLIALFGGTGRLGALGTEYLALRLLGVAPFYLSLAAFGYFQGRGDTKTPMRLQIVANVINVGLDYVLIFGLGPIPALGVAGAAIATVIAYGFQGAIAVYWLRQELGVGLRARREGWRELLDLGGSMGLRFWLEVLSWSVFTAVVARVGAVHLAAHTIAIRIISVSFLPGHGIGEAASILTGQAVGARDGASVRRVGRAATNVGLVAMGAMGVIFLVLGRELVGLFRPEASVLELGAQLLLAAAAFQLFDAIVVVKSGALNGTGDTRFVMWVAVLTSWLVLVPLGWALCHATGWGAPGAWVALTIHIAIQAAILARRWAGPTPVANALAAEAARTPAPSPT